MPEEKILPLSHATDIKIVGGKAKSLGELIRNGFNVPKGFVVTDLAESDDLEKVLNRFDGLKIKKAAVRSSAATEDSDSDTWAGQLDTYLNVTREQLINKIQGCFMSATSDRALSYAVQKNIKVGKVAVIVQKMVPAAVSGVAFSLHPVTNNKNQVVIESVKGLGEKLVSGIATPDTFVIDKDTGKVKEEHLFGNPATLSKNQLEEILEATKKIEKLFDFPVDIEWAYSNGQLFILQSRPITTVG